MKKTKPRKAYQFRGNIPKKALYFYNCSGCGKKRNSRIYERALEKICRVCQKGIVPENQPSLFIQIDEASNVDESVYDDTNGKTIEAWKKALGGKPLE